MDPEELVKLTKLSEEIKPKNQRGPHVQTLARNLYEECLQNKEHLLKSEKGARLFQIVFRKADQGLQNRFLDDLIDDFPTLIQTRYSCHIVKTVLKRGRAEMLNMVFQKFKGTFDQLMKHKTARSYVNLMYETFNSQKKKLMLMDFYGEKYKQETEPKELKDICAISEEEKNAVVTALSGNLEKICDKKGKTRGGAQFRITQVLLNKLAEVAPKKMSLFLQEIKDMAFSVEGALAAVQCIINSPTSAIGPAIKYLEECEYETDEENPLSLTSTMIMDKNGYKVLACAVSYAGEPKPIFESTFEVLKLEWEKIKLSDSANKFLVRLISPQPSVICQVKFQKDEVNPEIKAKAIEVFFKLVLEDIEDLSQTPGGRLFITEMLAAVEGDQYEQLCQRIFTQENIEDKIINLTIRGILRKDYGRFIKPVMKLVDDIGLEELLKTPGAWVAVEIGSHDKEFLKKCQQTIKEKEIPTTENRDGKVVDRPEIDALLNPKSHEPRRRQPKKGKK